MKVAVVFGGPSPEAEVSKRSADSVISALRKLGHEVIPVELDGELPLKLKEINPDKVFLVLHGSPGEDGTVQGLLEIMGIPYTGCGVIPSAVSIDKDLTKRVLKSYGIPVPAGITIFKGEKVNPEDFEFPCHCTGERGIEIFREMWEDRFIEAMAGVEIPLTEE